MSTANTIQLICPNLKCRKILAVPANSRGQTIRCGHCGSSVRVPELKSPPRIAPPAPAKS